MKKILTITVPSYNVERFLEQTLESFVDEQIMEDIEVLVVDDGSRDRTAKIGKEFAEKYPDTFRVISKENGGHGSTINRGIEEASGKYFKVVDGDDWVFTEGLRELVSLLKECRADYVFTNYYEVNDVTGEKKEVCFPGIPVCREFSFDKIAKTTDIPMHALVIRTGLLKEHGVRMDEHCFYVDVEYILYPVPYIEKVVYYDIFVYMYRLAQTEQSVSIKGYQRHIQDHIKVILHTLDYIEGYKSQKGADKRKIYYMERRIAEMVYTQTDIFLSFSLRQREIRRQFKEFDRMIKEKNQGVYLKSGSYSGMLRMLRRTGFRFYTLIVLLSRLRNRQEDSRI